MAKKNIPMPMMDVIRVGWIQEHKDGRLSFYAGDVDPRTIHDNGMPTYPVYRFAITKQEKK